MKPFASALLFCLGLGLPPHPGRAQDVVPASLTETADPVSVTASVSHPRRTTSYREFELDRAAGQSPANQFYDGQVEFATRQVDGSPAENTVYIVAVGLPRSNPYTLTVTRRSDGAVVPIGRFNVQNVSSRTFNLYLTADVPDDYNENIENVTLAKAVYGGTDPKRTVPANFDAFDIATVSLVDAQGIARLSGQVDPANRYPVTRGVVLHLYGDATTAPTAYAVAKGNESPRDGHTFSLFARHLPASTAVNLVADGTTLGQFTTGANGGLIVTQGDYPPIYSDSGARRYPQTLPTSFDLSKIEVLTLTDSQGNVLLRTNSAAP